MTDYLFNYRALLSYRADDAAGTIVVSSTETGVYTLTQGFGWVSSPPAGNNINATGVGDPRTGGTNNNTSRSSRFRVDMPNGNYKLRLASGQNGTNARMQTAVWDGGLKDAGTGVAPAAWTASAAIAAGAYVVLKDVNNVFCLLKTAAGGTNAATFVPDASNGPFTDSNGVVWTLIKRAIVSVDSLTTFASNSMVMDATGTGYTTTNWATSNVLSATFNVSSGFVEITRANEANNYLRHVGLLAQSTPLASLTFRDAFGATVTAPTIYAGQPAGTRLFRPSASAGATGIGNFSLDPTDPLYNYVDWAVMDGFTWAVAKAGIYIPDSLAGVRALNVIQTDTSSTITGSPKKTTTTTTIVSSNGKPQDRSDEGLMRTESFLILQKVMAMAAAEWNPVFPAPIEVGTALNAAQVVSLYNGITPDGHSAYRIKVGGPGNWSAFARIDLTPKDFFNGAAPSNTAGLIIEAAAGFTDPLNCKVTYDGARGVKVAASLQFIAPKAPDDPTGGGSTADLHKLSVPSTSIYNVVRLECDNGRYFMPGYDPVADALYVSPNTTKSRQPNAITCYHAEQLIAKCRNYGVADAEVIFGARWAHMMNDNRDLLGDAGAQGNYYYLNTPLGVNCGFADNNTYLLRETTHQTPFDHFDQFTGSHPDLNQSRAPSNAWNDFGATHNIVIGDQTVTEDGKLYEAQNAGVKGATRPSHSTLNQIVGDGNINWKFTGWIAGTAAALGVQVVVNVGNHAVCGGTTDNGAGTPVGPEVQLMLDSSRGCYPTDIVCINMLLATASQYGIGNASVTFPVTRPGNTYVEKCGMFGAPYLSTNQAVNEKTVVGGLGNVICRNSILGGSSPTVTGAGVIAENNLAVDWVGGAAPNRPQDILIGTFGTQASAAQGSRATFALVDDFTKTPAQMRAALEAQLLTPDRLIGARTKHAVFDTVLTESLTGFTPHDTHVSLVFDAMP